MQRPVRAVLPAALTAKFLEAVDTAGGRDERLAVRLMLALPSFYAWVGNPKEADHDHA